MKRSKRFTGAKKLTSQRDATSSLRKSINYGERKTKLRFEGLLCYVIQVVSTLRFIGFTYDDNRKTTGRFPSVKNIAVYLSKLFNLPAMALASVD